MERYQLIPGARRDNDVCIDSVDNFIYHKNGVVRGVTRFRCCRYTASRCRASLTKNEHGVFSANGYHNHDNDHSLIRKYQFTEWCRGQAANSNTSLHSIYMSALRRFPGRAPVQFVSIRSTMYRARQQNVPEIPHSPEHFEELINNNERYRMDLNGENPFFFGRVTSGEGEALCFVNVGALPAFLDSVEVHMDATFHAPPTGYYQLASLHAVAFGTSIQVASFLMTRKTQALYEVCLRRLIEVCQVHTGRVPAPRLLIGDFELAILQAMSSVFPTGRARGCYYHSGMSKYRYATYLGLGPAYRADDNIKRLVKMAIAIALLPPQRAWDGFEALRDYSLEVQNGFDAETRVRVRQFVDYIRSFWLERIGPERFCVFMDANRTNNLMEASHRAFNDLIGTAHPNPWFFLDRLQEWAMNAIYTYLAARDGAPVRERRRREYLNRDREIRALQSNFQNGRITIREFLIAAAHHFHPVELEFGDPDIEVINRPLNEVRAAFEALLELPAAVPVAVAALLEPPAAVPVAVAAVPVAVAAVPVAALLEPPAAVPVAVAVVAAEAAIPIAVENPGAVPAIRGRRRGRPPLNHAAPRHLGNRVENREPVADGPPAVVRGRPRGRPPGRGARARGPARVVDQPPGQARIVDQPPVPARVVDQPAQLAPFLDSDDSSDGDVGRFDRFFAIQEANFLNRRANVMARFQQNRQLRLDEDSEEDDSDETLHLDDDSEEGDMEAADQGTEVPTQHFPEVNHEGLCPVCWEGMPNTILTPCGHIFCLRCVQTLEVPRVSRCPVCRSRFRGHRPVPENDLNAANILLALGNHP